MSREAFALSDKAHGAMHSVQAVLTQVAFAHVDRQVAAFHQAEVDDRYGAQRIRAASDNSIIGQLEHVAGQLHVERDENEELERTVQMMRRQLNAANAALAAANAERTLLAKVVAAQNDDLAVFKELCGFA